jgi:hypothetical protein
MLRIASTKNEAAVDGKKRTNYLSLETASFVITGRPLAVLSTVGRHSDRMMKFLPVFKASTIAVFSSSTSWSSSGIPLLPSLVRKNLWTGEGDSLPRALCRRFPRRADDASSADPLFSANVRLILPLVPELDSFGSLA